MILDFDTGTSYKVANATKTQLLSYFSGANLDAIKVFKPTDAQ